MSKVKGTYSLIGSIPKEQQMGDFLGIRNEGNAAHDKESADWDEDKIIGKLSTNR